MSPVHYEIYDEAAETVLEVCDDLAGAERYLRAALAAAPTSDPLDLVILTIDADDGHVGPGLTIFEL